MQKRKMAKWSAAITQYFGIRPRIKTKDKDVNAWHVEKEFPILYFITALIFRLDSLECCVTFNHLCYIVSIVEDLDVGLDLFRLGSL